MVFSRSKNIATSFLRSRLYELTGLSFLIFSLALSAALLTHAPTDPSWSLAADSEIQNLLGSFGAITSDLFLQFLGPLSYVLIFFSLSSWGFFFFPIQKGSPFFFAVLFSYVVFFFFFRAYLFGAKEGLSGIFFLKV